MQFQTINVFLRYSKSANLQYELHRNFIAWQHLQPKKHTRCYVSLTTILHILQFTVRHAHV